MTYYMPVKIYDGKDTVIANHQAFSGYGTKALIVTGRSSAKRCGALQDVCEALETENIGWTLFDEIEENPSVETVSRGSAAGLAEAADFVIGIGGGSPLDAAKAIAFLMKHNGDATKLYDASVSPDALPVLAVPTTCGTGSEVTGVSVLTVHEKQTKQSIPHKIFPQAAFLDGKYLHDAPKRMILNTAVDALAHMLESFESRKADVFSMNAVLNGLALWRAALPYLRGKAEPDDETFSVLMRASCYAGTAIAQTGTSVPHALSYILTYTLQMPHGPACGYFLDRFLSFAPEKEQAFLLQASGFRDFRDFSSFLQNAVKDYDVPAETLQRAYDTVKQNTARLNGCRFAIDETILHRIVFDTEA